MKFLQITRFMVLVLFLAQPVTCPAEETAVPLVTDLSSTVVSGYVDVSVVWSPSNGSAHGYAGTWVGIVTDRSSTNRIEIYLVVDANGNFSGRFMSFNRTLGSDQFDGALDKKGRAKIDGLRFDLARRGVGTVIGRGEAGRPFSARLMREVIK